VVYSYYAYKDTFLKNYATFDKVFNFSVPQLLPLENGINWQAHLTHLGGERV
jgi:hypothetical protein